jgi:hypothetical protein
MRCTRIVMSHMNTGVKLIAVAHAAEHAQHTSGGGSGSFASTSGLG